ncbi:phospholipase [Rhodococcus sp. X156]|uniref:phospholipase n=1 Tax=Rhodococcus sp. X156 TaxID=2499145 RepID=UPI000FDC97C9|nr:phospholipase [Rhodococcus sp. X156]
MEQQQVQGGSVVLDIGGDIGALVVHLPDRFAGTEIDISHAGSTRAVGHTGVHVRAAPDGTRGLTAVYPELVSGSYQLWDPHQPGRRLGPVVHVEGGLVAQLSLLSPAQAR